MLERAVSIDSSDELARENLRICNQRIVRELDPEACVTKPNKWMHPPR